MWQTSLCYTKKNMIYRLFHWCRLHRKCNQCVYTIYETVSFQGCKLNIISFILCYVTTLISFLSFLLWGLFSTDTMDLLNNLLGNVRHTRQAILCDLNSGWHWKLEEMTLWRTDGTKVIIQNIFAGLWRRYQRWWRSLITEMTCWVWLFLLMCDLMRKQVQLLTGWLTLVPGVCYTL